MKFSEDILKEFNLEPEEKKEPVNVMQIKMRKIGQTMNYNRYYEQLKNMSEPVFASQLPNIRINLSKISKYAIENGISINQLSEQEKKLLIESVR